MKHLDFFIVFKLILSYQKRSKIALTEERREEYCRLFPFGQIILRNKLCDKNREIYDIFLYKEYFYISLVTAMKAYRWI